MRRQIHSTIRRLLRPAWSRASWRKYVTMPPHTATIFALWICFTHVYTRFQIAPRVALTSEGPDSGKSTALEVARRLVLRPNPETLGTGAAIADFLDQGPCTILLDELDQVDAEARRRLQQIWNMGHARGASISLMVGGRRTLIRPPCPGAGGRDWPLPGADAEEQNVHARDGAVYGGDQTGARV